MEIADDLSLDEEVLPVVYSSGRQTAAGWLVEEDWGRNFDTSYMPVKTAWALVMRTIVQFRAKQLPYIQASEGG